MERFLGLFGVAKPVTGTVRLGALPGAPAVPVPAHTGVRHATAAEVPRPADGCVPGSARRVGGDTRAPVDPGRAADFMARARAARGG